MAERNPGNHDQDDYLAELNARLRELIASSQTVNQDLVQALHAGIQEALAEKREQFKAINDEITSINIQLESMKQNGATNGTDTGSKGDKKGGTGNNGHQEGSANST